MSATILKLVGLVLENFVVIGVSVLVGHRFAPQVDKLYNLAEGVVGAVYGLVRPKKAAATAAK